MHPARPQLNSVTLVSILVSIANRVKLRKYGSMKEALELCWGLCEKSAKSAVSVAATVPLPWRGVS